MGQANEISLAGHFVDKDRLGPRACFCAVWWDDYMGEKADKCFEGLENLGHWRPGIEKLEWIRWKLTGCDHIEGRSQVTCCCSLLFPCTAFGHLVLSGIPECSLTVNVGAGEPHSASWTRVAFSDIVC